MKANNEARRQLRNDKAVSPVVGTMLMLGIVCTLTPIVMMAMGNYTAQFKASMDAYSEALIVSTNNMKNVTDYMSHFHFRVDGGNNSTSPPYVEPQWNTTTQEWDYYVCQGHQFLWVKLGSTPTMNQSQAHLYNLTIVVIGKGYVTRNPSKSVYASGTMVQLNATANTGWGFMHWGGNLTGATNPISLTMNSNKTVYATFNNIMG